MVVTPTASLATALQLRDNYCEACSFEQMQSDLDHEADASAAYLEIEEGASKLYFWGYGLDEVLKSGLFGRLSDFIQTMTMGPDAYTPMVSTTLAMLALHDHPEARIVEAIREEDDDWSFAVRWVEFCHHGNWYTLDPVMAAKGHWLVPACLWLSEVLSPWPTSLKVIDYDDFWSSPVAKRLYYELREPRMSRLWFELLPPVWDEPEAAQMLEEAFSLQADSGFEQRYPIAGVLPVIVDRHVINLMMADQLTLADILREFNID